MVGKWRGGRGKSVYNPCECFDTLPLNNDNPVISVPLNIKLYNLVFPESYLASIMAQITWAAYYLITQKQTIKLVNDLNLQRIL